jgi:hypothetical protein
MVTDKNPIFLFPLCLSSFLKRGKGDGSDGRERRKRKRKEGENGCFRVTSVMRQGAAGVTSLPVAPAGG